MAENLFKPLKKARLYEEIVDHIKGLIIEGKLKPSDKLPSERELACQFNVGRPTVREAIRTLILMGLVEVNAGQRGSPYQELCPRSLYRVGQGANAPADPDGEHHPSAIAGGPGYPGDTHCPFER